MNDNGEGPPNDNAKDQAERVLKDASHKRDKGSRDDERTRDDELPAGMQETNLQGEEKE